ncbi:hypothetical protein AOLI_G00042210 [Acnodon oligacanthus]
MPAGQRERQKAKSPQKNVPRPVDGDEEAAAPSEASQRRFLPGREKLKEADRTEGADLMEVGGPEERMYTKSFTSGLA